MSKNVTGYSERTTDILGKSVTEYGKEIADILSGTPNSLQGLQGLISLYMDFANYLIPSDAGGLQERLRMAYVLVGCMKDKAEQIQADLERLEMVCDEMKEA